MYWIVDYPSDMERFFEVLGDVVVRYHRVVEREAGIDAADVLDARAALHGAAMCFDEARCGFREQ